MPYQMPIHRVKCRYIAGIDPDIDKSGLVIYDRTDNAWYCATMSWYELWTHMLAEYALADIEIVVEAGWENKSFFHMGGVPAGFEKWDLKARYNYVAKMGSQVGTNFGIGKTIVHSLSAAGYAVRTVAPESKKWDAAMFKGITRLEKGYNEEIRDAARTMHRFI